MTATVDRWPAVLVPSRHRAEQNPAYPVFLFLMLSAGTAMKVHVVGIYMALGAHSDDTKIVRKKNVLLPRLMFCAVVVLAISLAVFAAVQLAARRLSTANTVTALYDRWQRYDYRAVYDIAGTIIDKKPLQNTARTFRGYSSFYLAVSEPDITLSQMLLDEAVNNLRIAMQNCKKSMLPQIYYMLGKTYFYKDSISSYRYYADLAVKYLSLAEELGYRSNDIAEYIGLSHAALGHIQQSIAAFTEALLVRESDTLLLAIAEQYCKNGQGAVAKQYLVRANELSSNDDVISRCHLLLGQIYTDDGEYALARKEFDSILEKNENSADAHYGLGVLYEKQGLLVNARSEWRKALKLQVNHPGALQKMADAR